MFNYTMKEIDHLDFILTDVDNRKYSPHQFVIPLSFWRQYDIDEGINEIQDMIRSGMTGGESL